MIHSLPGGKRGQAPVTLSFCCFSRCQGYSQQEKAPRLPQGTWVESRGSHPLQRQGFGRRTLGGDQGQGGTQQCHIPSPGPAGPDSARVGGSLLWREGVRAPSRCQAVGRLGGALGPLDDGRALLPPQQLVVLKETLVAGHAVRAIGEGQETCGGEGSAGSEEAGAAPTGDGAPGKKGRSGRCWKGPCRCQHSPKP